MRLPSDGDPPSCAIKDVKSPVRSGRISVAILAGGRGLRMGSEKAEIVLAGERLIDRAIRRLAPLSDDLLVVLRSDQALAVSAARLVRDERPYEGPLAGIAAGLAHARHPWVLVVACDMPFVSATLVTYLVTMRRGCDAVVPRLEVGLEPLLALYHRRCLAAARWVLEEGQHRVADLYTHVRVCYAEEEDLAMRGLLGSFANLNAPTDLLTAEAMAQSEKAVH